MKWVWTAQQAIFQPFSFRELLQRWCGCLMQSLPAGQRWPRAWLLSTLTAALDLLEG